MAIDPTIALQVRQPDIIGSYERGLSIRDLMDKRKMADEERQAQRTLADLYRGNTGADGTVNRQGLVQGLASAGQGARIPALEKQFADADKAGLDAKNTQSQIGERDFGVLRKRVDASNAMFTSLLSSPNVTHDDVIRGLVGIRNQGLINDDEATKALREVPGDPGRLRQFLIEKALQNQEAGKRLDVVLPKFQQIDAGNRVVTGTVDQMSGQFTPQGQPVVKAPEGFVVGPDGRLSADPGYVAAKSQIAAAGRPVTQISMGQKGFENELKLRGDFKQEPVYKAHQEMQSAYSQIQQALKQASPAGDLAGATKIMKLLDPGSVVRESEHGMAMAATGMLDRVQNYAQNVINGTKLTPSQRADFQRLADALMSESVTQFNAKRGEYQQLGSDYGLKADRALGPEAKGTSAGAAGGKSGARPPLSAFQR